MPVTRISILPAVSFSLPMELIRNNMINALTAFELSTTGPPRSKGYEDELRGFVYEYLIAHFVMLKNLFDEGPHVPNGTSYYRPDMLLGSPGIPGLKELKFKVSGNQFILTEIIEWGHDHATSLEGCVNKPITDFLKWLVVMGASPNDKYYPLPLYCFQIATDFSGTNMVNIVKIRHALSFLNILTDIWVIDYASHPAKAYIFMTYFPAGMNFHTLLSKLDPFYARDLSDHLREYYKIDPRWPLKCSVKNGKSALDVLLTC
jgi:hypothetical protein